MQQVAATPRKEIPHAARDAESGSMRLARRRLAARFTLAFERLWPLLWPPLAVIGFFIAAALFGFVALLPAWPRLVLLLLVIAGAAALTVISLARFSFPTRAAADHWLEKRNGLAHRPLTALADQSAVGGVTASLLWHAHRARMAASLAHIRVGLPHPNLAARDRRALRLGLVVALVAGVGVAGADSLGRLAAAFTPRVPIGTAPPALQLAAWITPPAYTHLPPLFLKPPGGSLAVPAGSRLAVSLTGGSGAPRLSLAGQPLSVEMLSPSSFGASATLAAGGRLILGRGGTALGAWDLSVITPTPPTVRFTATPGADSRSSDTRFPWHAEDVYGVTDLSAVLRLAARPTDPAVRVPIPLPGGDVRDAGGTALVDLTANPWAGLEVIAELQGKNGAGLTGKSSAIRFRLPEAAFQNPLARALIAVRKHLVLHPRDREFAIVGLNALSQMPQARNGDFGAYLNMRAIASLLAHDRAPAAVSRAVDRLWQLAWHYEAGPTERTARALAAATRALQQALAEAGRPGGPQQRELDRRLSALEQAIQKQIEALAKQLAAKGAKLPESVLAQRYDQQTFERMVEAMRQAIAAGDLASARAQMAELQRLLQQLQNARPPSAADMARARQWQKGQQAMAALGDVVQREGALLDRAERRLASPASPAPTAPSPPGAASPAPNAAKAGVALNAERRQDAAVQQALRRVLGVLMSNFADATGKVPPALGKADIAMRGAVAALGAGADRNAAEAERRAIAALQKGGQQAMAAMAAGAGRGTQPGQGLAGFLLPGGGMPGNPASGQIGQTPGIGLDPFGRPTGDRSDGGRANGFVNIPERDVAAEARAIQEELRRREANPALPVPERDYIDRLLKQF